DVDERPERAVLAAHEDRGLSCDLDELEIAGLGQAALMARAEPVAHDHAIDVPAEDVGIAVERLVERVSRGTLGDQRREPRIDLALPAAAVVHRRTPQERIW